MIDFLISAVGLGLFRLVVVLAVVFGFGLLFGYEPWWVCALFILGVALISWLGGP